MHTRDHYEISSRPAKRTRMSLAGYPNLSTRVHSGGNQYGHGGSHGTHPPPTAVGTGLAYTLAGPPAGRAGLGRACPCGAPYEAGATAVIAARRWGACAAPGRRAALA